MIRGYEPPCTQWMRVELEDAVMAASKDPVVNGTTTVTIERQEGANGSRWEGNTVAPTNDYTVDWQ
ncbi:MAG: hypothetical protein HUJ98_07665 [Bacteroidaceae bacterium]|nr:hypothetical protein [Bacteroidaceae bacterium]